ncbi:MAG: exodeoxyribonuclease VII large subunit [Rhodospirillaceae bacterium]|nr:MAG: exodeoxyribonuclease VII large subunit [Rhodospirillaceae bacterium]
MSDTANEIPDAFAAHNAPALSVSEVSAALKRTIEDAFGFVRVRGEISQPKVASSGHCYLRLKDENANLDAIIWRGTYSKLGLKPEEGMEVIVSGRLTTYPGRSSYQLIVEAMELAGQGALLKLLEERRRKLAAEGLFDEARKKPLPALPVCIGVVTSPTGAVIRDILHRIADRFPRRVLLWPVKVQGDGAAAEVAAAIAGFNALKPDGAIPRPDVIIVARGGGSLEDLWAFNEEIVVRAAAASGIPLIAAVGHETDWTLIDHAADRRAPTPTAAAEMAVPVRLEQLARAAQFGGRLTQAITRYLDEGRIHLQGLVRGIPRLDMIVAQKTQDLDGLAERLAQGPQKLIQRRREDLVALGARLNLDRFRQDLTRTDRDLKVSAERLANAAKRFFADTGTRVTTMTARLESVSPRRVLERGYAMVWDAAGSPVTLAKGIATGDSLKVEFADGSIGVTATGAAPTSAAKPARSGTKRPREVPGQGSLL